METPSNVLYFSWIDYTLFIFMLALSAVIGVYFGFFGKKQDSPKEYLHGGKKMKIFPIAASLIASDTSGITLLGVPADIYVNGSSFTLCIFAPIFILIFISNVFLPVFYKLQISSTFEYLRMRFSNRICVMTSFLYTLHGLIYLPVVIYMPALAFGQVTGMNLNIVIPIVCLICIFYTTIGGIKAVVWTDTLQMFMMIGSLLVVFILGVIIEGGFENVWQKSDKGSRIDFNLDFDPTSRTAAFTIIFGLTVYWCGYGHNPVFVQRFLAVPTLRHAQITVILLTLGIIFFKALTSFLGLIIYAHYTDCDPLTAGYIQKVDQILPYYIMDVASTLPGLPGLFIAGIFCAALSTMSSGLNTMSGTIYADFIQPRMPEDTTDKRASDVMKLIVVVLGLVCMGLVFIIQFLGAILQLTFILGGITAGPMLAMFVLGMLIPSVNEKGILYGSICGIIITGWVIIGTQYYILTGQLKPKHLPTSTESCLYLSTNTTGTLHDPLLEEDNDVLFPYKLSFYYYGLLGFLSTSLVAIPVSLCTGGRQQHVNKDLLCPLIHSLVDKKYQKEKQEVQNEKELIQLNKNNIDTDYLD